MKLTNGCKLFIIGWLIWGGAAVKAQSTWTGGGSSDNWSDDANWDTPPVFPGGLIFDGNTRLNATNDLSGKTVTGITFDTGAGGFVLSGQGITLGGTLLNNSVLIQTITLNLALNNGTVVFDTGAAGLNLTGNLTGNQAITIQGAGKLGLSGSNSYTGAVTVNTTGTIVLGSNYALNRNSNFTLNAGYLDTNGYNVNLNGLLGNATTATGGITNSSATQSIITFGNNGTGVHLGGLSNITVSGNIALVINTNANNQVTMNVANSFTGGVTIKDNIWAGGANLIGTFAVPNNWRVINAGFFGSGTVTFAGNAYMGNNNSGVAGWTNWTNDIKVTGTNNWLAYYTDMNSKGNWSGDGSINIWQGWTPTFTLSGSMAAFTGTLNLIGGGANNGGVGRVALAGNATDLSNATVVMMSSGQGLSLATPHYGINYLLAGAAGTYQIGDLSTLATVTNNVGLGESGFAIVRNNTGAGTVTFEVGALNKNSTFSGMITDSGSVTVGATPTVADTHVGKTALTKVGTGTWALSGSNSYTGATTVSGGVLLLSGSGQINSTASVSVSGAALVNNSSVILDRAVTLGADGIFGGSGTVSGALTISDASGGFTGGAVGDIGTLTISSALTLGNFTYQFDLVSESEHDLLNFSGGLTLSGGAYTVNVNPLASLADFNNLVILSGLNTGDLAKWSLDPAAQAAGYSLDISGNQLLLNYAVQIPEPSAWALLLGGTALLLTLRRRR